MRTGGALVVITGGGVLVVDVEVLRTGGALVVITGGGVFVEVDDDGGSFEVM